MSDAYTFVIPAQAGIPSRQARAVRMDSRLRG
jgi:hypothetical protein